MELLDNVNKTLKDDLGEAINGGSKIAIAAAFFSIYAYQELKAELEGIDELRFIFTSPTFVTEKVAKESREFYIPRGSPNIFHRRYPGVAMLPWSDPENPAWCKTAAPALLPAVPHPDSED